MVPALCFENVSYIWIDARKPMGGGGLEVIRIIHQPYVSRKVTLYLQWAKGYHAICCSGPHGSPVIMPIKILPRGDSGFYVASERTNASMESTSLFVCSCTAGNTQNGLLCLMDAIAKGKLTRCHYVTKYLFFSPFPWHFYPGIHFRSYHKRIFTHCRTRHTIMTDYWHSVEKYTLIRILLWYLCYTLQHCLN